MKHLTILSTLLCIVQFSFGQIFSISSEPIFRDEGGRVLPLALTGGLNQPQFSNLDVDKDGKLDLVVYDRDGDRVLTFIATHSNGMMSYVYDPTYEVLFPQAKGYILLRDYNNDGINDVFYYDGDSLRLWENLNSSIPSFLDKGGLFGTDQVQPVVFNPYRGLRQPNGCLPAIVDLDFDNDLDFVTNLDATGSSLLLFENQSNEKNTSLTEWNYDIVDKCYGGIDERAGLLTTNNTCLYREVYKKKHSATKTLCYVDNDGDGDLDLFYGNSEALTNPVYFFENGKSDLNFHKDTFIRLDTAYFTADVELQIPPAPGMFKVDVNLDGVRDMIMSGNEQIKASFPIRQKDHVLLFINENAEDNPDYQLQSNSFLIGDMVDLGGNVAPVFGDMDGDGDQDLLVGTSGDHYYTGDTMDVLVYYENIGTKSKPDFKLISSDYLGLKALGLRSLAPALADVDNDGDLDLYLGNADGTIAEYTNIGSKTAPTFELTNELVGGIDVGFFAAPDFSDMNDDGLLDLVVGSVKGTISLYLNTGTMAAASFVLENDSFGGIIVNERYATILVDENFQDIDTMLLDAEGNSAPRVLTFNNGDKYIAVGGLEGKVRLWKVNDDLSMDFEEEENYMLKPFGTEMYTKDWGYRVYPGVADLNDDKMPDMLIGTSRGGFQYVEGNVRDLTNTSSSLAKEKFRILPNPANGQIMITTETNRSFTYNIMDVRGRIVQQGSSMTGQSIQLVDEISAGVYFVSLTAGTQRYQTQKMMISK